MACAFGLRPVNWLTTRDLFAGALALIGLTGIMVLLALSETVPAELWALETLVVGYVIRGTENGGLKPKVGKDQ